MAESDAELSHTLLYCSLLGFAVISWLLWKFVLSTPPAARGRGAGTSSSPSSATATARGAGSASTAGRTGTNVAGTSSSAGASRTTRRSSSTSTKNGADDDEDEDTFGHPRHPPHYIPPECWSQKKSDVSGCLVHGIVPFRSTPASGYETRLQKELLTTVDGEKSSSDMIVVNRRERARIFARMFSAQKGARPPNRGANIVVTIRHGDVSCSKLQKALYLLGTYYNLFVLIDGSGSATKCNNDEETRAFIKKLRSQLLNQHPPGEEDSTKNSDNNNNNYKLNAQILPLHRIAFSSTNRGRVAFVRQLHGTELVVDCEEDVTKELERFGFRVLLYPKEEDNDGDSASTTTSALGNFLIP